MQRPRVWPIFVVFVVAVVAMGVGALVAMRLGQVPVGDGSLKQLNLTSLLVSNAGAELALLLCVLVFTRPLKRERLRLHRSPANALTLTAICLGTLAVGQVLDSASALLGYYDTGVLAQLRGILGKARGLQLLFTFVVVAVLAGTAEELFFRGFTQTRLVQRWGRLGGIVVTSLLFGLMHMDPVHSILAAGIGLWLGWSTERAGSIRPAMLAHVVNNAVAIALAAAGLTSGAVGVNVALLLLSLVVAAGCAWVVARELPVRSEPDSLPVGTSAASYGGAELPT